MKQNIYIAALLAGMLALAGCGGGGSSSNEPPPPPADDTTVSLPKPIDGTSLDGAPTTIKAGEEDVPIGGLYFSCPAGGKDCVVTVPEDRRANKVNFTGAKPTVSAAKTPASVPTQTNPRQGDSNDPLSRANLLAAVLGNDGDLFGHSRTDLAAAAGESIEFLDKTKIQIWLKTMDVTIATKAGDNYIYYGIWTETADAGNLPPEDAPKAQRRWSWGGSMPYGTKPDASLTTTAKPEATYTGNALLHYKVGDDPWNQSANNAVTLTANFAGGWIYGHVSLPGLTGSDGGVARTDLPTKISLKTAMYSSDTFNGTAEFQNATDDIKGKGAGSWQGQFFGDTTMTTDGKQSLKAPSHVAGEFSVSRNKNVAAPAVSASGTFGAACGNACDGS